MDVNRVQYNNTAKLELRVAQCVRHVLLAFVLSGVSHYWYVRVHVSADH